MTSKPKIKRQWEEEPEVNDEDWTEGPIWERLNMDFLDEDNE